MEINHTYITHDTTRCVTFANVMLPLLCHLNTSISRRTHSRNPTPLDDTSWRTLPHQKMTQSEVVTYQIWLILRQTRRQHFFSIIICDYSIPIYNKEARISIVFLSSVPRGADFPRQDEQDMRFHWNHVFDRLIKHVGTEVLDLLLYDERIHCVYSYSADC
jgi:hypothetical protein